MSNQLRFTPVRVLDANGDPIAGAEAFFDESGTSNPATVYADTSGTAHPRPVVADAQGTFPAVYIISTDQIKVTVKTPTGDVVNGYPIDPVPTSATGATNALQIAFTPISNNTGTTVAEAIENNSDAIATFPPATRKVTAGVGLTGGGDLSADITLNTEFETQANAEAGTGADKVMTAERTKQAIDAQTLPIVNGIATGDVGDFAFAAFTGTPPLVYGSTVAGSDLHPAIITSTGSGTAAFTVYDASVTLTGNWRAQGGHSSSSSPGTITLFKRIS